MFPDKRFTVSISRFVISIQWRIWHHCQMGMQTSIACQQIRAELVETINQIIDANGWTQYKAADLCGQTQPRISDLKHRRSGRFSIDALVNIIAALTQHSTIHGETTEGTNAAEAMATGFLTKRAPPHVKGTYALATKGSKTEREGEVIEAGSTMVIDGHRVACVGDTVRYPDGSESKIISGAGFAMTHKNQPMAIVGSTTDNGDKIISSLQSKVLIHVYDDQPIPGLLDPSYCPDVPSAA